MKIKYKISIAFILQLLAGFFILTVLVSLLAYNVSRRENLSHLETATEGRVDHLETYFNYLVERLELLLARSNFKKTFNGYIEDGNMDDKESMRQILAESIKLMKDVDHLYLLGRNGIVLISSDGANEGKEFTVKKSFVEGKDAYSLNLVEDNGEIKIFVSGPILYEDNLIGVGVLVVDLSEVNRIVTDRTGLGETGEILLGMMGGDGNPIYLNEQRFDNLVVTDKKIERSQPMKMALAGESGSFVSQYNYAGSEVMAVVRYMEDYKLGVVSQINEEESMRAVKKILLFFFGLVIFFVAMCFVITTAFARSITRPIELLQLGIKTVEEGNLDHQIETGAKDEIGVLTQAYNRMTAGIKKSRASVDRKVREQTMEIQKRSVEIKDQQRAVLNILEDVDEEKHNVEKEKDKLDKILFSIGDGVFVVDKNLKIILYNQAAAKISGYSTSEARGKNYRDILKFVHDKSGEVSSEFIDNALKTGKIQEMSKDTVLVNKSGERVAVADSAAPLVGRDGKVIGCVVVFRDVTKEREVDRAKTEFVSLASHQLRTPLSAINWYAEMLIAGDAGKVNPEQKEYLEEIYKGNQRMVDLVNSLLDVSRIELGTFAVEPTTVDLKEILDIIVSELKNKIETKKLIFKSRVDSKLKTYSGDPKLLNIIFQNLISNAVKYTPDKGEVRVEIKKGVDDVSISVADSGIGIPTNQQDKIFSKLFRADNVRETDTEGTGLGLYIVRSIIEQSGGKISFVSKQNKGTVFTVLLPVTGMKKKEGAKQLGS